MTYQSLFVSHGAPDIVLRDNAAHQFLKSFAFGETRPKAIVIMSAHNETRELQVSSKELGHAIYDFGNFDRRLNQLRYDAPGEASVQAEVIALLEKAGFAPKAARQDYDHGVWTPLYLMRQEADIPLVQVSINPEWDAKTVYEIGLALRPLAEKGVLLIGSGALTHNLHAFFRGGYGPEDTPPHWVEEFAAWVADKVAAGNTNALINWEAEAPYAYENHPTPEHFLPLFFALGASGEPQGLRLHQSVDHAVVAMDVYGWGKTA